jgi:hypothetical protein
MMNPFFQDPNEIRLPPEQVRLVDMQVFPISQTGRVKINLKLTPFQKKPCLDVTITAADGKEAAHTSILEAMLPELEFTMHLRQLHPGSEYAVDAIVYYQKLPDATDAPIDLPLPEAQVVDRRSISFILPEQAA